jgi:hypothetical protein
VYGVVAARVKDQELRTACGLFIQQKFLQITTKLSAMSTEIAKPSMMNYRFITYRMTHADPVTRRPLPITRPAFQKSPPIVSFLPVGGFGHAVPIGIYELAP